MRRMLVIAGFGVVAAAAAQVTQLPLSAPGQSAPLALSTTTTPIAIAYTAEEGSRQLRLESWSEAGPALGGMAGWRVDYFTVEPATVVLRVGENLDLNALTIDAHGLNGNLVGGAPLEISLEAPEGMFDLALATTNQQIVARAPGVARLWIAAALPRGTGTGEHYRLPVVILVG